MKSRLYMRYGRYYLLMFLLPIIILGLFLYFGVLDKLEDELRRNQREDLLLLSRSYEEEIELLKGTARQIQLSPLFSRQRFQYDPIYGREIIDMLKTFSSLNPVIDSIMIYFADHPYVYSDSSTLSLDFLPEYFKLKSLTGGELISLMKETSYPYFYGPDELSLSGEIYGTVLLYLIPLYSSGIKSGTAVIRIISQSFEDIYVKDSLRRTRYFFLTAPNGRMIYNFRPDDSLDDFKPSDINLTEEEGTIRLGRQHYLLDHIRSDNNNLLYTSITPYAQIRKSIRPIILILLVILVLLIALGTVITLFFTKKTYQPIAQLKEISQTIETEGGEEEEILFIRNTLLNLIDENKNLIQNSQISRNSLKKDYIFKLLKGSVPNQDFMEKQGEEFLFTGMEYLYASGILRIKESAKPFTESRMISLEDDLRKKSGMNLLIREAMDDRTFYFVISHDHEREEGDVLSVIKDLFDSAFDTPSIYMGSFFHGWRHLSRSFIEAQICMEYGYISPRGKMIYYPSLSRENRIIDFYSPTHLYSFRQSIRDRDRDSFTSALGYFIDKVKETPYQIRHVKALTFDLKNACMLGIKDLERTYTIPQNLIKGLEDLHREETFLLFCKRLEEIFDRLLVYCDDKKMRSGKREQHKYADYIEKNYMQADLSLDKMAEDFNMSPAGFSRSFKKNIRLGFMEYLSHMRIEKSKEYLSRSDMVLQEIAEAVGYMNVPSFIRRFRQREGLTPGEYRKLQGK